MENSVITTQGPDFELKRIIKYDLRKPLFTEKIIAL